MANLAIESSPFSVFKPFVEESQISVLARGLLERILNPNQLDHWFNLLDGNCIEKSHHRIKELRDIAAGSLPGKSFVVYDPLLHLPIDLFPCEDGHAQERSLLKTVLKAIVADDVWIADRNFCVTEFTCGIKNRDAWFIIR